MNLDGVGDNVVLDAILPWVPEALRVAELAQSVRIDLYTVHNTIELVPPPLCS